MTALEISEEKSEYTETVISDAQSLVNQGYGDAIYKVMDSVGCTYWRWENVVGAQTLYVCDGRIC